MTRNAFTTNFSVVDNDMYDILGEVVHGITTNASVNDKYKPADKTVFLDANVALTDGSQRIADGGETKPKIIPNLYKTIEDISKMAAASTADKGLFVKSSTEEGKTIYNPTDVDRDMITIKPEPIKNNRRTPAKDTSANSTAKRVFNIEADDIYFTIGNPKGKVRALKMFNVDVSAASKNQYGLTSSDVSKQGVSVSNNKFTPYIIPDDQRFDGIIKRMDGDTYVLKKDLLCHVYGLNGDGRLVDLGAHTSNGKEIVDTSEEGFSLEGYGDYDFVDDTSAQGAIIDEPATADYEYIIEDAYIVRDSNGNLFVIPGAAFTEAASHLTVTETNGSIQHTGNKLHIALSAVMYGDRTYETDSGLVKISNGFNDYYGRHQLSNIDLGVLRIIMDSGEIDFRTDKDGNPKDIFKYSNNSTYKLSISNDMVTISNATAETIHNWNNIDLTNNAYAYYAESIILTTNKEANYDSTDSTVHLAPKKIRLVGQCVKRGINEPYPSETPIEGAAVLIPRVFHNEDAPSGRKINEVISNSDKISSIYAIDGTNTIIGAISSSQYDDYTLSAPLAYIGGYGTEAYIYLPSTLDENNAGYLIDDSELTTAEGIPVDIYDPPAQISYKKVYECYTPIGMGAYAYNDAKQAYSLRAIIEAIQELNRRTVFMDGPSFEYIDANMYHDVKNNDNAVHAGTIDGLPGLVNGL